jgi:hypothetical protein
MKRVLAMKIVTQLYFEDGKGLFRLGTDEADIVNDVSYAYKQTFLLILLTDVPFAKAELFSNI